MGVTVTRISLTARQIEAQKQLVLISAWERFYASVGDVASVLDCGRSRDYWLRFA